MGRLKAPRTSLRHALESAVGDSRFQNGRCTELFQLIHDGNHILTFDHHLNRTPLIIFQRVNGRRIETGCNPLRFGQLVFGYVVFQ